MFVDTGSYLLKGANTVSTATSFKNHSSGSGKLEKRRSDSTLSVDCYWIITLCHTHWMLRRLTLLDMAHCLLIGDPSSSPQVTRLVFITRSLISHKLSSEVSKVGAQNLPHLQLANLFRWKI